MIMLKDLKTQGVESQAQADLEKFLKYSSLGYLELKEN